MLTPQLPYNRRLRAEVVLLQQQKYYEITNPTMTSSYLWSYQQILGGKDSRILKGH